MLEKEIETKARERAMKEGWICYKFQSPNLRSVPDRIFVKGGCVVFIEFKAPNGRLTTGQTREIDRLKRAQANVGVAWNVEDALDILDRYYHESRKLGYE